MKCIGQKNVHCAESKISHKHIHLHVDEKHIQKQRHIPKHKYSPRLIFQKIISVCSHKSNKGFHSNRKRYTDTYFEYKTDIYIFEMKEYRYVFNSHLENYSYANYTLVIETWGHFEYDVMPHLCVCMCMCEYKDTLKHK